MAGELHWFPGHMAKTLRRVAEKLPQMDAVVQLLDARAPQASLNPDLQALYGRKPRLYVLNKADLADTAITDEWLRHLKNSEEIACVALNSRQKGEIAPAKKAVENALAVLFTRRRDKGMAGLRTRVMVTGIPNVGKSTFINSWAGTARAKAEDRPGVTRGEQWISAGAFELLDLPGLLCKKMGSARIAVNLALIGSMPDRILDTGELAAGLLAQLAGPYAGRLCARYKLGAPPLPRDGWVLLEQIGRARGMLLPANEVDMERAAAAVLDEFRAGKLGRLSLERPGAGNSASEPGPAAESVNTDSSSLHYLE